MSMTVNDQLRSIVDTEQPQSVSIARPGLALAAALLGFFVITLDAVVVNVALPAIRSDLGGGIRRIARPPSHLHTGDAQQPADRRRGCARDRSGQPGAEVRPAEGIVRERRTSHGYQTSWLTTFRQGTG